MIRGPSTARSLLTMASDFQKFRMAGPDIRKAKEFHNVIDEPLFKIPIEHVSQTLTSFRDYVWHIYSNNSIFNYYYIYMHVYNTGGYTFTACQPWSFSKVFHIIWKQVPRNGLQIGLKHDECSK